MTIKTTGSLSLLELQNEFGGSNPISISEYYKGTALVNSNVQSQDSNMVSSGAISLSNFYGAAKNAWVVSWDDTANFSTAAVAVDAAGNSYVVGSNFLRSEDGGIISKIDSTGTAVWHRQLANVDHPLSNYDVAYDPTYDYIYSVGYTPDHGVDIVFHRTFGSTAVTDAAWQYGNANFQYYPTLSLNTDGNIFMACISGVVSTPGILISKQSGSTILAQPTIFSTNSNYFYVTYVGCHYDKLNSVVYQSAYQNVHGLLLAKYNDSLTLSSTIQCDSSISRQRGKPATDSAGNVYVVSDTTGPYPVPGSYPSRTGAVLMKFNSSLSLQWARSLSDPTSASSYVQGRSVVVDSFDNVIVGAFWNNEYSQEHGLYAKYSSSGVLQFMRTFLHYTGYLGGMGMMAIDSKNDLLMTEPRRGRLIKVPTSVAPFPGGTFASQIFPNNATGVVQDAAHTVSTFSPSNIDTGTSSSTTQAYTLTSETGPSTTKDDIFGP